MSRFLGKFSRFAATLRGFSTPPSPSPTSSITFKLNKFLEVAKVTSSQHIPNSETIETHGATIKTVGELATTHRICYCLALMIRCDTGKNYGFMHFEGHQDTKSDIKNLVNLLANLKILNGDEKKHSAIIYGVVQAPDVWSDIYNKQSINFHNVSKVLKDGGIDYKRLCGSSSAVFVDGEFNKIYEFNLRDVAERFFKIKGMKNEQNLDSSILR